MTTPSRHAMSSCTADRMGSDAELLDASMFFDRDFYQSRYADLIPDGADPISHYLREGASAGCDPCPEFSTSGYLAANPEVAAQGVNPLVHFLRCGLLEGRPPGFGESGTPFTLDRAFTQLEADALLLRTSSLFDADYYLRRNPDVAAARSDPVMHYLRTGADQGRDPSEAFSTSGYRRLHADVAAAGVNPLVHYLRSGKAEGRTTVSGKPLIPSVAQLFDERWPCLRPLPAFAAPGNEPRLTLVLDSLAPSALHNDGATAFILATLLANRLGAVLRVATRREPAEADTLAAILATAGISLSGALQITFVPDTGEHALPLTDGDLFITTSWQTTRSTLGTVKPGRLFWLVQDDERMHHAAGDEQLLCAEALNDVATRLIVKSSLLQRHFQLGNCALPEFASRAVAFEPAFPDAALKLTAPIAGRKCNFLFCAQPSKDRSLFWRGALALVRAIEDGVFDPEHWDFHWIDDDAAPIMLPRGIRPKQVSRSGSAQVRALIAGMDAAMLLGATPSPSGASHGLAAAGTAVLTTSPCGEPEVSTGSANIVTAQPTMEALCYGLVQIEALGRDDARRAANRAADTIGRDWNTSLAGVLSWITARLAEAG